LYIIIAVFVFLPQDLVWKEISDNRERVRGDRNAWNSEIDVQLITGLTL